MNRVSLLIAALFVTSPLLVQADSIGGTITGSTVTAPALANDPNNRDDTNTATTLNIKFFTYCPFITADSSRFAALNNLVFAGLAPGASKYAPPAGLDVSAIKPSDFTISNYIPWVVNNTATINQVTAPSTTNNIVSRNVSNRDAGGADIVISYTPSNQGDPTSVNFLQAFIQSTNGGAYTKGRIDSAPSNPYYNFDGVTGIGTTRLPAGDGRRVPEVTNSDTAAWMVDIPFRCENGPIPPGGSFGCLGGRDDTLISQTQIFQTFIESNKTCSDAACGANRGKTYEVLYGGVQWGYTYTNADTPAVPEPSYASVLALLFAGGWTGYCRRSRRRKAIVCPT